MTTLDPGAREVLTHGWEVRPRSTALRARSPAASITDGLEVLVQEVMAAMTTWPWSRSKLPPSSRVTGTRLLGRPLAPVGSGSNQPAGVGQGDPVLGPAGAGQAGHDRAQVELDRLGVAGLGGRVVPQALVLGVRL